MHTATVILTGVSPYSQSRHYTDPPKKEKESHRDYEARTWMHRCHYGADGKVFIPPMAFKNCLSEAAKYLSISIPGAGKSTYTKHFEAGILVLEGLSLPITQAQVKGEWLFVPADGKRGGSKRVEKCFPVIHEWEGVVTYTILDDKITKDVFSRVLTEAGNFIGIGRFRPRNNGYYGRFSVKKIDWE